MKLSSSKENESPDFLKNPYQAIVAARDSLKQREEVQNVRAEIKKLDDELNDTTGNNKEKSLTIQELERELMKRRRRAEKCRRLAEAQSSYKNMLEKMIRDAMHQTVVYKEQMRLNKAATSALMARLEAQKATCDASEKELHKKFKERDELEKQIRPELEQTRKRLRLLHDEDLSLDDRDSKMVLYLPGTSSEAASSHKELRVFLEEEQKASEADAEAKKSEHKNDQEHGEIEEEQRSLADEKKNKKPEVCEKSLVVFDDEKQTDDKLQKPWTQEEKISSFRVFPVPKESESEEDEESRRERGKGNVEKWLQILLESNNQEDSDDPPQIENKNEAIKSDEDIIEKLDRKFPLQRKVTSNLQAKANREEEILGTHRNKTATRTESAGRGSMSFDEKKGETRTESSGRSRMSFDEKKTPEKNAKEQALKRSESARAFRRIPSSPSLILGMKKGVDCIRKKPLVTGDDDENEYLVRNNFMKTIKRAMKF